MDEGHSANRGIDTAKLQLIGTFRDLPVDQVQRLSEVMIRKVYAPGQIIFVEGEESIGLWFVEQGQVKIAKHSMNGRILSLCIMRSGMCFGTCPLFSQETNPATAEALTEVTLLILPQDELVHYRQRDRQVAEALLRIYAQRLAHLARLSEGLATWTAADRINDTLIAYAENEDGSTFVQLTHEKLADLAGTVREIVTRHLARLEREGIITLRPGRITLLSPGALQAPCAHTD